MAVLNKDNNGYLTPEEFNLFAKQAQLEIFEEYFYNYNNLLNKNNKRLSNTGYADLPRQLEEVIDQCLPYISNGFNFSDHELIKKMMASRP